MVWLGPYDVASHVSRRWLLRVLAAGGTAVGTGGVAAAPARPGSSVPAAWAEREVRNYAKTRETPAEQASDPSFFEAWQARSAANAAGTSSDGPPNRAGRPTRTPVPRGPSSAPATRRSTPTPTRSTARWANGTVSPSTTPRVPGSRATSGSPSSDARTRRSRASSSPTARFRPHGRPTGGSPRRSSGRATSSSRTTRGDRAARTASRPTASPGRTPNARCWSRTG